jgi:Tfp pilus assembly protein PilX
MKLPSPLGGIHAACNREETEESARRPCANTMPLLRLHKREDGFALVLTMGVLLVLSILGSTVIYYTSANARSANWSNQDGRTYSVAEAALHNALAVLFKPGINPYNKYMFCDVGASLPCARTATYDNGTATWSGTFDDTAKEWTITASGSKANPTGAASISRKMTVKVAVSAASQQLLNNPSWNYIYSRGTGQACDTTYSQSVEVRSPIYVEGNLCLSNQAWISGSPLDVHGSVSMLNTNTSVGKSGAPVAQVHIKNGCKYTNSPLHNPCLQGAGNAGFDNLWATSLTSAPATIAPPTVEWDAWYLNANPGPYYPCATTSGTPPLFDNDQGLGSSPNVAKRNISLPTVADLAPPTSSYTCRTAAGELSWNHLTKVLTLAGTTFIDGSAKIENGGAISYTGQGVMYVSGTFLVKNTKVCAVVAAGGGDCTLTGWTPSTTLFTVVANGDGAGGGAQAQVPSGDGIQLVSARYQGALYATKGIDINTTSIADGPLDGYPVRLGQSTSGAFPALTFVPPSMPGNDPKYGVAQPPGFFSG